MAEKKTAKKAELEAEKYRVERRVRPDNVLPLHVHVYEDGREEPQPEPFMRNNAAGEVEWWELAPDGAERLMPSQSPQAALAALLDGSK